MINDLIQKFLDNFNYLNSKDKRCGSGLFRNKGLILALEGISKKMREDLSALTTNKALSEKDKTDKFFEIIKMEFDYAQQMRGEFGTPIKHAETINMRGYDNHEYQATWKKPYPPAKFEKQLIQALASVNAEIASKPEKSDALTAIQERCTKLIDEIQNYQAPEKCLARVNAR